MTDLQAVYYRAANRREPVRDFIASLDDDAQAALERQVERLNMLNEAMPHLPFPHSSQVDGELRELRCHYGRQHYRILYRRSDQLLVLLHAFAKRSATIADQDIAIAQERWEDFRARMDAPRRVPPRAAGHDAP